MNAKAESQSTGLDLFKWLVAAAIIAGGVYGFYYFEPQVLAPVRVVGLLVVFGIALLVASLTTRGRNFMEFMKEANVERQKVVWPTRAETLQTTMVVIVVVVLVGIMIWLMDWVFGKLIAVLVG